MDDDINTPEAIAVLFDLAGEVNKTKSIEAASLLKNLGAVLGILQNPNYFQSATGSFTSSNGNMPSDLHIEQQILKRLTAKKERDFVASDQIREELSTFGIVLEDTPTGTTWRRN